MEKKLYRITNGIGDYYVVAEHPTQADEKLTKILNDNDYGFTDKRNTVTITVVATEIIDHWLTDRRLIL